MADTPSKNTHPLDPGMIEEAAGKAAAELAKENRAKGQEMIANAGGLTKLISLLERKELNKRQQQQAQRERIGLALKLVLQGQYGRLSKDDVFAKAREYDSKVQGAGVEKLVQMSQFARGGALLPEEFMNEVTEYLRDTVVVFNLGIPEVQLVNGGITIPYIASGISSSYTTEGTAPNASTITFGQLKLESRKILTVIPLSNDWLDSDSIGGSGIVADDLSRAMSDKMNSTLLRSTGGGGEPVGIRHAAISANQVNQTKAGATVTVAEAGYDMLRLQYLPKAQKVTPRGDGHYVISPRTELALKSARDGNNNSIWLEEMLAGTIYGQRWHVTTAIPDNLSVTGSADSEILFGYMSSGVLGQEGGMNVEMFDNAAYVNSSGSVVSGLSQDESVLRAKTKHDLGFRHQGKELAVIIDCDWTKLA